VTRDKLLNVRGLNVAFGDHGVVRDVDLAVGRGEVVGLVGESGSGKSLTALAIIRLLPDNASQTGAISLNGQALDKLDEKAMCRLRGRAVGMVFQEPMTALNPLQTIGHQVAESIALHRGVSRREALADARETLDRVGLSQAAAPLGRYPHELSGGQRQRVVIAIAIAAGPSLLIADEPTTALDVSTQAGILTLLKRLTLEEGMGLLLISHDLAVVAAMADRICVMKEGAIVDRGAGRTFIAGTTHPYTRRLVAAASHVPLRSPRLATGIQLPPLLKVDGATRDYRLPRRSLLAKRETLRAVDGVSFSIDRGENLGLVGESGCGKSTLARRKACDRDGCCRPAEAQDP
jgi:peptide/nickel transport system ATP-binding protein